MSPEKRPLQRFAAFTLIEILVSVAILMIILVVVFSVIERTSSVWRWSTNRIEAFQSARFGFEEVTRNLSQATLNTYLDYDSATIPKNYLRKSELAFVSGRTGTGNFPGTAGCGQAVFFQAPLGYVADRSTYGSLEYLMNTCGYYVDVVINSTIPPHVRTNSNPSRYRLMQLLVPSENDTIYTNVGTSAWFTNYTSQARPLADNVIALVIRLQDPGAVSPATPDLSSDYTYDSTLNATAIPQPVTANQLPPIVQVTMVAIDEVSAKRLDDSHSDAITQALTGKFQAVAQYADDLTKLKQALAANRIQYRVFSVGVPIRESKWTK